MPASCFSCLTTRRERSTQLSYPVNEKHANEYQSHESMRYRDEQPDTKDRDAANDIVHVIASSEIVNQDLRSRLEDMVHQAGGWRESLAKHLLAALEDVLRAGKAMAPALKSVFEKAHAAALEMEEFAGKHPILTGVFCTVVALGVLYLIFPAALEALGFSSLGPVRGSWAALWQSKYGARVPVGSLFSYLQHLGMTMA